MSAASYVQHEGAFVPAASFYQTLLALYAARAQASSVYWSTVGQNINALPLTVYDNLNPFNQKVGLRIFQYARPLFDLQQADRLNVMLSKGIAQQIATAAFGLSYLSYDLTGAMISNVTLDARFKTSLDCALKSFEKVWETFPLKNVPVNSTTFSGVINSKKPYNYYISFISEIIASK